MTAGLLLGHGAIAVVMVLAARAGPNTRARAAVAGGIGGVLLGVALVAAASGMSPWRSTAGLPGTAVVAGSAIAAAWLLALVLGDPAERWRSGALVGVAATGLALFSFNRWIVPALLFWICSSVALALLVAPAEGRGHVWLTLGLSDVALVVAVAAYAGDDAGWALPNGLTGWPLWAVIGCMVVRAGVLPRAGVWGALRSPAACGLPLLVGGSFVLATRAIPGARPWIALGLVLFSLGAGWLSLRGEAIASAAVAAWPMGVLLALCFISNGLVPVAGAAAVIAAAVAALWGPSGDRGRWARGLVLSFAPVTAGFSAVAAGAVVSFEQASGAGTLADAAPWTALAAVLPLTLALGVLVAVVVTRQDGNPSQDPVSAGWTWILASGSVVGGVLHQALGRSPGAALRIMAVYLVAAGAGVVAFATARRDEVTADTIPGTLVTLDYEDHSGVTPAPVFAALAMAPALLAVVLLTLAGLKVGFL